MNPLYALLWDRPRAWAILLIAVLVTVLFIGVLSQLLTPGGAAALVILDYQGTPPPNYPFLYPFTIQNLTHLLLFLGLGEVFRRWRAAAHERALLAQGLLPEEYSVVLQSHDLPPIRARVAPLHDGERGFLPGLIDLCILQFLASRSVDQTVSVLNSSLELLMHRVDLRYNLLRYLTWAIPTVGFIGTVIGISLALAMIDPSAGVQPLGEIALALGVSFYTTLVALVESAILVFFMNLVQVREELAVNDAGHYTLTNLINRLYAGGVSCRDELPIHSPFCLRASA